MNNYGFLAKKRRFYCIMHIVNDPYLIAIPAIYIGGARDVMVIVDRSSNPGRDCISHSTNTLGKGMYPIILPPAMGK